MCFRLVHIIRVLLVLVSLTAAVAFGAANPAPVKGSAKAPARTATTSGWDEFKEPGSFIVALAQDRDESLWVGTEEHGVFRYRPHEIPARQWTQFTTTNGLGDDFAYSLVCDHQGRLWAGHLNHGVSVFNGAGWTNYDMPDGPIGERVFKLAVCPTDGDVWLGTSAGQEFKIRLDEGEGLVDKVFPTCQGGGKSKSELKQQRRWI